MGARFAGPVPGGEGFLLPPPAPSSPRADAPFEARAAALARPYAEDPEAPQRMLSQRILKHLPELFVFVEDLDVPGDNNLAERSLRTVVIARKISGGTRSPGRIDAAHGANEPVQNVVRAGPTSLETCRELLLPTPCLDRPSLPSENHSHQD